jgi:hypothetical protein
LESPQDFLLGFTFSSEARSSLRRTARSAIEGAALSGAAIAVLRWKLEPGLFLPAAVGVLAAFGTSTVSLGLIVFAREFKWEFAGFMKAWGAGVFVRAVGLAALMAAAYGKPQGLQMSLLGSYALGILFLLLVEYRQLAKETG